MSTEDSPLEPPKLEIDAAALYAAIEELRPLCRQSFILAVWENHSPAQIVAWMASQGITLTIARVEEYLLHARKHCLRRLIEAAERRRRAEADKPAADSEIIITALVEGLAGLTAPGSIRH
jgi:hypothetical protein